MNLSFDELMQYTEWQRAKWRERLGREGDAVLATSAGPHGDGRINTVGEVIRHIFGAELRYCQRLSGEPLTDAGAVACDRVEPLFAFGEESRARLRRLIAELPAEDWDTPRQMQILTYVVTAAPRKIVAHALMHEIRHWAQLATLLRLGGAPSEFHDLIASPAMGGSWETA